MEEKLESQSSASDTTSLTEDENPLCWPVYKKWIRSIIVINMSLAMGYYSGVHAASVTAVAEYYDVSQLASTSAVSFFLLGFAVGPLLFAPLSEMLGRNPIIRVTFGLFVISNIGCALAPSIEVLLFFRLLGGLLGAPTVTNTAGSLTDMWPSHQRAVPLALFTAASFLGFVIGPICGGPITQYASWQWDYWSTMIFSGLDYIAALILLPETYAPVLLRRKQIEQGTYRENIDWKRRSLDNLVRPWIMYREPIVVALSIYMAFLYGLMTLSLVAYPIVYVEYRGWSTAKSALGYVGLGVGMGLPTVLSPLLERVHERYVAKLGKVPEARFPLQVGFAWLTPIGLFWFAWTATAPSVSPAVSIAAGVFIGIGMLTGFLDIAAYLTDCYGKYGASSLAANGLICRLAGAAFPLFSDQLYASLGVPWGTTLLALIATVIAPTPWIFYRYGPKMRERSSLHLTSRDS